MIKYVKCGITLKPHGLKGEIKVKSYSSFDRFSVGNKIYFLINGTYNEYEIVSSRYYNDFYYIVLKSFNHINLITSFIKQDIYVIQNRDKDLANDEYYYSDLVNLAVYEDKTYVGKVLEVCEIAGKILLKVKSEKSLIYVPFNKEIVLKVSDKIVVDKKWGLF